MRAAGAGIAAAVAALALTACSSSVGGDASAVAPTSGSPTLVLGTHQLGTYEFTVDGPYDRKLVANGVGTVLTGKQPSGYGLSSVTRVNCPDDQAVAAGNSFACSVVIGGETKTVTVDIVNSEGWYIVGQPS